MNTELRKENFNDCGIATGSTRNFESLPGAGFLQVVSFASILREDAMRVVILLAGPVIGSIFRTFRSLEF